MESFFTLLFALVMVVLIIYLSYRFSRYVGSGKMGFNRSKYINVVDRVQLSQDQALLIAKIGDKNYLIGTSSGSVGILAEIEEETLNAISLENEAINAGGTLQPPSFKDMLGSVLTKKKK